MRVVPRGLPIVLYYKSSSSTGGTPLPHNVGLVINPSNYVHKTGFTYRGTSECGLKIVSGVHSSTLVISGLPLARPGKSTYYFNICNSLPVHSTVDGDKTPSTLGRNTIIAGPHCDTKKRLK